MSVIIPLDIINQFLPNDKLELDTSNNIQTGLPKDYPLVADLSVTARDIVRSKMANRYNVETWFVSDTPSLMMNIAGMLVAGWVYDRQFAEEAIDGSSYGVRLIEKAYKLLDEAMSGGVLVEEALFATDTATQSATYLESDPAFLTTERF